MVARLLSLPTSWVYAESGAGRSRPWPAAGIAATTAPPSRPWLAELETPGRTCLMTIRVGGESSKLASLAGHAHLSEIAPPPSTDRWLLRTLTPGGVDAASGLGGLGADPARRVHGDGHGKS